MNVISADQQQHKKVWGFRVLVEVSVLGDLMGKFLILFFFFSVSLLLNTFFTLGLQKTFCDFD